MAIKCLECNGIIKGSSIPWKCPLCGNKNIIKFTRVDDDMTDRDRQMHERDKAFLESRRV